MKPRADECCVRPIPTKASYTSATGDVVVPLWITRHGHYLGDVELVLAADAPPSRLADVLADPAELDRLVAHVWNRTGGRVYPLDTHGASRPGVTP